MNQEKYIGMDVHAATISAAVKNVYVRAQWVAAVIATTLFFAIFCTTSGYV